MIARPRFTVRRLLVVVALLGLFFGGVVELLRRRDRFLRQADWHATRAYRNGIRAGTLAGGLHWKNLNGEDTREKWPTPDQNAWHISLYEKYKRAARYPWLPVPADPPEPK